MILAKFRRVRANATQDAHISVSVWSGMSGLTPDLGEDYTFVCDEAECCCDPWEGAAETGMDMLTSLGYRPTEFEGDTFHDSNTLAVEPINQ